MRSPDTYTERDERRWLELANKANDAPATEATDMIERLGKAMLGMTAAEVEDCFCRSIRSAFERGLLDGNSPVVFPAGGLRNRACASGLTIRARERRVARRLAEIDEGREQEGALIGHNPPYQAHAYHTYQPHAYHAYQMTELRLMLSVTVAAGNQSHTNTQSHGRD